MNHVQPQLDLFYLYIPALYLPPSPQFLSELPSIDSFFLSALPSSPPPLSLPFNQGSGQPTPFPTDPKKKGENKHEKKKRRKKRKNISFQLKTPTKPSTCRTHASENTLSLNRQLLSRARTRMANFSSGERQRAWAKPVAKSWAVDAWKPECSLC